MQVPELVSDLGLGPADDLLPDPRPGRASYQLGDARQLMLPGALSGVSAAGRR